MFNIYLECLCGLLVVMGLAGSVFSVLPLLDAIDIFPRVGLFCSGLFLAVVAIEFRHVCIDILLEAEMEE